ncbi:Lrp/AsnC family transcriptional regulator [Actinokineospora spheciospongiae]|uniref:Lrp/AsnC family transcriptional regulator n=1 Tax=Actinokineospora spheciospongiae TaxID=909613 RepID=UPI000D70EF07|nr:Lrp/AsnC family transcriptional regulator [Actinokineospora spheciospongiae]PWW53720.1 DNA-binding Lrp family transcriptional regulator [Actinokineospora spheciospongiae]
MTVVETLRNALENFPRLARKYCVPPQPLDDLDHRLLALLQQDSGKTLAALGDLVGLSPSAVQRRITRYRETGLITRTVAVLDPRTATDALLAICAVTLDRESVEAHEEFRAHLLANPHVQQLYNVTGDHDYIAVLATTGIGQHRSVADEVLKSAPNIRRYTTMVVLDPLRTTLTLPTR